MVCGIALISVVTATLASWIVQRVSVETEQASAATEHQVESLRVEVAELKQLLRDTMKIPAPTAGDEPSVRPGTANL